MIWKACAGAAAAVGIVAASLLVGPAPARAQSSEGVVAIINDEAVSTYDVRQRASLLLAGSGLELTDEALERAQAQALRDLIDERLQMQEAREKKVNVEPQAVDRTLADIARQNGTDMQALSQQLASQGINVQTLRGQIEADIAWNRLVGGRFGSRIRISDVQINDALARISANAAKPQYLLSEILLAAENEEQFEQAAGVATRLIEEMRTRGQRAPFPAVARQFSASATAVAGGDIGWLSKGELKPELQAAVDLLAAGEISPPIRAPNGIYILALRDKRDGIDPSRTSRVTLRQVTAPTVSRAQLERLRRRLDGCEGLEAAIRGVPGAAIADLGEAGEAELSDEVRARITKVDAGSASPIFETPQGLAVLAVCARRSTGEGMPTRQEVEGRLREQELAMLSQRYLRNLRRDSTIIYR
jgi:peptidyl-prolyl cis-trans isomerase SurA